MDKLKVLLVLLLAAVLGLALSLFLLALAFAPTTAPEDLFYQIVTEGFPSGLPFIIPLSTLLFLSTVLASVVGVIYFLVLPEMKDYYSNGSAPAGRDASAMEPRPNPQRLKKCRRVISRRFGSLLIIFCRHGYSLVMVSSRFRSTRATMVSAPVSFAMPSPSASASCC